MENVAEAAASTPAETPQATLDKLQPAEYDKWRMTGDLPEPTKEDSDTSKDPSGAALVEGKEPETGEPAKPAPESEAGKAQEQKPEKKNAESRIKELLADRARERERADKAEASIREYEGRKKPDETRAESSPPKRPKPTMDDLNEQGQPKYATLEEWADDLGAWHGEQAVAKLKAEHAQEKADAEKAKKQAETEQQNKTIEASWQKRVKEAGKKHADFNDIVFGEDSAVARIPQGSMMDSYILEAEAGAELLYHLAQHGEEVDRIAVLGPAAQARELAKLELSLPEKKKAPDKKFSTTPNPPAEVGGKGIAADDPVAAAVTTGDFAAFQRLENAKDFKAKP